jgi:acylphosphatase
MDDRVRWKIIVTGRVQGVGYRYSAAEKARRLGVSGHVKNMADGSVHLEAEGAFADVAGFYDWCRKGPPMARIIETKTADLPVEGSDEFRILR